MKKSYALLFSIVLAFPAVLFAQMADGARWIMGHTPVEEPDSLLYLDHPADLMQTGFVLKEDPESAILYITAAGYYETWINGDRAGDQRIDPAWTDFSKRLYARRLDVTKLVRKGKNVWGIMTGNGFYNPLPLRMWGNRDLRKSMPVGDPCAIGTLRVSFSDGSETVINTDGSWRAHPGPVTRNNVYLGEWYDARLEIPGWNLPGTRLKGWQPVREVEGPGGDIREADFPPVRITSIVDAVSVKQLDNDKQIIDFGQNFAGQVRLSLHADRGDTIRIRYGELLYPDGRLNPMTAVCGQIKRAGVGGPGAPPIAEQKDVYVASGGGPETFRSCFTFHGFRYAEVDGLKYSLDIKDVQGERMNTDVAVVSSIISSSPYLDKLNENCRWTFLSNLQSVQSDCPAREKFGYGGDINATMEAYIYNFDMDGIYRKIIRDWADALKPDGFVDTAPFVGIEYCGISWESAFLFLQDALWLNYGDTAIVREMYPVDKIWMEKVARLTPGLLVKEGLSDHESLRKVPVELTGTVHYFQLARIMAHFAILTGDQEGATDYRILAERIRQKIIDTFWDTPEIKVENQQTLLASLISAGVLDHDDRAEAVQLLLDTLAGSDYHVTTGIFGTRYLLEALSSTGHTAEAFRIVNQSGFPGWKYMIDHGATTVWETWKESDNTFSQNHPMFGSVSGWYLKWLGGIQPDPDHPGPVAAILKPRPVREVDSLSVSRVFPRGDLVSRWRWDGNNIIYDFDVPDGVKVTWVPASMDADMVSQMSPADWVAQSSRISGGFRLSRPGHYRFLVRM